MADGDCQKSSYLKGLEASLKKRMASCGIYQMNVFGRLTTICILQMPELIQSAFTANVCCPSEEFIIATASSCS